MDKIRTVGVDLAKSVFHVVACEARGREVGRRRLSRGQVLAYFAQLAPCVVGMEACASAHHGARQLTELGHTVRLMAPHHVRAYRRGQKNDYNDARAIGEAVGVAQMRVVAPKSQAQQDLQSLVRLREGAVGARTAHGNRLRGLLAEYGIVLAKGTASLRRTLGALLAAPNAALSERLRPWLGLEWQQWRAPLPVPWATGHSTGALGLVPRQHSSGGQPQPTIGGNRPPECAGSVPVMTPQVRPADRKPA